jgi:hypothetical protein
LVGLSAYLFRDPAGSTHDGERGRLPGFTEQKLRQHPSRAQQPGAQIGVDTSTTMSVTMDHPPTR